MSSFELASAGARDARERGTRRAGLVGNRGN